MGGEALPHLGWNAGCRSNARRVTSAPRSDASHLLGALTSQPCFSGRGPGVAEHGTSRAVGAEGTVLGCLLPQQVPGSLWGSPSLELQPSWPRNGTALPAQGSPGRILKPLGGRDLVPLPLPSLPLSVMQRALSTEPLGQQVHVPTAPHSWRKPAPPKQERLLGLISESKRERGQKQALPNQPCSLRIATEARSISAAAPLREGGCCSRPAPGLEAGWL